MYRSLLVPLDGSAYAEQALPLALSIARRAAPRSTWCPCRSRSRRYTARAWPAWKTRWRPSARAEGRSYLDGVVQRIAAVSPVPAAATLLEGPVAESLYRQPGRPGSIWS